MLRTPERNKCLSQKLIVHIKNILTSIGIGIYFIHFQQKLKTIEDNNSKKDNNSKRCHLKVIFEQTFDIKMTSCSYHK